MPSKKILQCLGYDAAIGAGHDLPMIKATGEHLRVVARLGQALKPIGTGFSQTPQGRCLAGGIAKAMGKLAVDGVALAGKRLLLTPGAQVMGDARGQSDFNGEVVIVVSARAWPVLKPIGEDLPIKMRCLSLGLDRGLR